MEGINTMGPAAVSIPYMHFMKFTAKFRHDTRNNMEGNLGVWGRGVLIKFLGEDEWP